MKSYRLPFVALGLFFVWLLVITILRPNLGTPVRLFSDDYDRSFYFERGSWLVNQQVPYRDTVSEYPQVPTYLFGLMRIVTLGDTNISSAYWNFSSLFSILMLLILFATIALLDTLLEQKYALAYLLLLPAPLFFTINRFDILPAFITLLSYKMIRDKRWLVASLLLGIGALTKWYPALLLPAYMLYAYRDTRQFPWKMALVFLITCSIIILPTLLVGGVDALAVPYRFQTERDLESASLPRLLIELLAIISDKSINSQHLGLLFLLLQVISVPCLLFVRIDTLDKLLNASVLIISGFILFSRIYSPQWMLWILPFCILTARSRFDIAVLTLYGILTYFGFPITWDYFGFESSEMSIMGMMNAAFILVIIGITISHLRSAQRSLLTVEN